MTPETRYTIAFIAAKLVNPDSEQMAIYDSSIGTRHFNGDVNESYVNLSESYAGNITGSGSSKYFSSIRCDGTGEEFSLRVSGSSFDGSVGSEQFRGSVSGNQVRFDSGENYQLQ